MHEYTGIVDFLQGWNNSGLIDISTRRQKIDELKSGSQVLTRTRLGS